jgi:gamma-glutamyltranspeptidase/glutathione hydrolase
MKGAVSSGHPLTSKAAIEMFALGGNAFDAVISAGFASVVTEPSLTSLGGGGFLLAHIEKENKNSLFDFFVNTPGLKNTKNTKPVMNPVEIKFPGCTQVFHVGLGSVAVPGMLQGLLYIHKRLCTLPIDTILLPALTYLKEGIEINKTQELFMHYLKPILTLSDYGKQIYMENGRFVKQHDRIFNSHLKDFLQWISKNADNTYRREITEKLVQEMKEHNGLISRDDLDAYRVIERTPLCIKYRDREIITNPPPSFGGIMLALNLKLLESTNLALYSHESEEYFVSLIESMKQIDTFRSEQERDWIEDITYPFSDAVTTSLIESYKKNISDKLVVSTQGTTHISVIDEQGNAASMTTSNGSASGHFIPETGIMLNNMMGEDDLHPEGFFVAPHGKRVSSMMVPAMIMKNGRIETVLGSGGSKRIRTAILHVLVNTIDLHYPLRQAIEASRIHWEDGIIQAEPDIPLKVLERHTKHYNINVWNEKNMYFGGVHAVNVNMDGWGDKRRGGNFFKS